MNLVKENYFTIPNIISILRILAVPYFGYLIFENRMADASLLFLFMAISDFLDGFLARKFDQISSLGKMLDPLADKLVILVTVVVVGIFSSELSMPFYFVIIVLTKEASLIIGIIILYFTRKKLIVRTLYIGKVTMFFEYSTIVLFLITSVFNIDRTILEIFYIVTSVSAAISMVAYAVKN